ncbi:MAG: 5-methylcytosine-specific restriction protein B, partial [Myxococcota bacterium]
MACSDEPFVLIIDEFNRGDVPRIFGELLTLLELDKRERVRVELPLSGVRFTVPRNVRILATMNTSDRSISLLDAALRRRFGFVEYLPNPQVLG